MFALGSSPHTRGAHGRHHGQRLRGRIIPAYAGSTVRVRRRSSGRRDHPRIRGEHQVLAISGDAFEGSSPHTRGALDLLEILPLDDGIIPAYAGSTHISRSRRSPTTDHPRIRGEHLPVAREYRAAPGSSPHTRGARRMPGDPRRQRRIIPAYAGSTA